MRRTHRATAATSDGMDYEDFDIGFETGARGDCSVHVTSSPAGQACGTLSVAGFAAELEAYRAELDRERLRSTSDAAEGGPTRELEDDPPAGSAGSPRSKGSAQKLGRALFASLFTGEVLDLYLKSLHYLGDEIERALRIRLSFDSYRPGQLALCALPWELLRDGATEAPLALDRRLAVVRHLMLRRPIRRPLLEPPIRTLVLASNPPGTKRLDLDKEFRQIEAAWQGRGRVHLLREPTLTTVREALLSTSFHQVHFAGHGTFERILGEGTVLFHHADGHLDRVTSHELVTLLRDHSTLRLVVVNSCSSGAVGSEATADAFAGIATGLMLAEVPCVVAQRHPIPDPAAVAFGGALHRHLAAGEPIEAAVVEARHALAAQSRSSSVWATPVLFSQLDLGEGPPWPRERTRVRRALETLRHERFVAVSGELDPAGEIPPASSAPHRELPADRRDRAERLLSLAAERGEDAWIGLQESILAVRSPFSPFDGSLRGWVRRPSRSWQVTGGRLVGLGLVGTPFRDAPDDLREAALLTWEELRFRDGKICARIWLPLLRQEAGAGLLLRHWEGRGLVLGLLRSSRSEAPRAEIWLREGLGWRRLAADELREPDGDQGSHDLDLCVRAGRVELRTPGAPPLAATFAADLPAGHAGVVRFGATAVEVRDLLLTVWRQPSTAPSPQPGERFTPTTKQE